VNDFLCVIFDRSLISNKAAVVLSCLRFLPALFQFLFGVCVEATKKFFDEVLEKGKVSQETIDAMDNETLVALFGLEKCDNGYWRMEATDKASDS
jgi:hypothetical protein